MPVTEHASSSATHRVVVTGAGIITSMGTGWRANADGFRSGRLALRDITLFDTSRQRVHRGGEVVFEKPMPQTQLSARQLSRLDRASRLLVYAGCEAMAQCGWSASAEPLPLCLGTSAGAMAIGENYYKTKTEKPSTQRGLVSQVILYQPHTQAQTLANALGVSGPVTIISNACASGANAIGHAFHLVKTGRAPQAIAGGYDALAQMVFAGFDSLQALSTGLPRPFDANRDGLALGEGAAIVMLERYEDAVARGAQIIAEICGYGASTDLHHLTQPHPQGDAALLSMTRACEDAQVLPSEIEYINSHGTGTPLNDVAEGMAIQRWAGVNVARLMVSSTKASIGHLLGGAGAVEAVICMIALREGFVPPTTTIETLDPVCTFDVVREPRDVQFKCALTNSFGFGGANATLIMRRGQGAGSREQGTLPAPCSPRPAPCFLTGWGAVSSAGWSARAMHEAIVAGDDLPYVTERRNESAPERRLRKVPALTTAPEWMKHPRMRRTTMVARYAVHAAIEALGTERLALVQSGALRLGIVFCTMNGCVQFSRRFFAEVLENPAFASPILFPETVYNAPASHLSALLGSTGINYTLVGDSAQFVRGMELATQWLEDALVDACLIIGAEELDWVSDEAMILFGKNNVVTEGAAAVLLERGPRAGKQAITLQGLAPVLTYGNRLARACAAREVQSDLQKSALPKAVLFDGLGSGLRADTAESAAWNSWHGERVSVRNVLGEGFAVTAGWQTVAACERLAAGSAPQAIISAVGNTEQATGMVLGGGMTNDE
jgi:3-oxoacyl-[acyl-carrier-protein] synthase II